MKEKIVWQFTNKRKLTNSEFVRYFESKVKKTIRKYQMPISPLREKSLKARVLNSIIKDLPERKGKLSDENLDNISNKMIKIIMYSKVNDLKNLLPSNQPLYFLSNKEILLYAKIKKIKGKLEKPKSNLKEIDNFVVKIEEKNPDIRHNIVNALLSTWRQFYKI